MNNDKRSTEISGRKSRRAVRALFMKDAPAFFLYIGLFALVMLGYLIKRKQGIDDGFIMLQSQWVVLLVLGASIVTEQREEKTRGYDFLKILPLSPGTLVFAKFLLVLAGTAALGVINGLVLILSAAPPGLHSLGGTFLILGTILALLMAGLMYALRFRFGQPRATLVIWLLFIPLAVAPIILLEMSSRGKLDPSRLLSILLEHPVPIRLTMLIFGAAGFAALWRTAVRFRTAGGPSGESSK